MIGGDSLGEEALKVGGREGEQGLAENGEELEKRKEKIKKREGEEM